MNRTVVNDTESAIVMVFVMDSVPIEIDPDTLRIIDSPRGPRLIAEVKPGETFVVPDEFGDCRILVDSPAFLLSRVTVGADPSVFAGPKDSLAPGVDESSLLRELGKATSTRYDLGVRLGVLPREFMMALGMLVAGGFVEVVGGDTNLGPYYRLTSWGREFADAERAKAGLAFAAVCRWTPPMKPGP